MTAKETPCGDVPQGKVMSKANVLAARRGYADALTNYANFHPEEITRRAAAMYPLPKKLVPREVTMHNGTSYRIVNGKVEYKSRYSENNWATTERTVNDLTLLGELVASPLCEVEDDS